MSPETLAALDASIKHWEENVAGGADNMTIGAADCALCRRFHPNFAGATVDYVCNGCPVMNATGLSGCRGTPYYALEDALEIWQDADEDEELRAEIGALALAELNFLKALRPIGL